MQTEVCNTLKVSSIKRHECKVVNQGGRCDYSVGNEHRFVSPTFVDKLARFVSRCRVRVKVDKAREELLGAGLLTWMCACSHLEPRNRGDTKAVRAA